MPPRPEGWFPPARTWGCAGSNPAGGSQYREHPRVLFPPVPARTRWGETKSTGQPRNVAACSWEPTVGSGDLPQMLVRTSASMVRKSKWVRLPPVARHRLVTTREHNRNGTHWETPRWSHQPSRCLPSDQGSNVICTLVGRVRFSGMALMPSKHDWKCNGVLSRRMKVRLLPRVP